MPVFDQDKMNAAAASMKKDMADAFTKKASFRDRGLGDRTVEVLVDAGVEMPECLLFMNDADIKKIRGIGKMAFEEIEAYRARIRAFTAKSAA